jgi:uncharacterized protein YoxC
MKEKLEKRIEKYSGEIKTLVDEVNQLIEQSQQMAKVVNAKKIKATELNAKVAELKELIKSLEEPKEEKSHGKRKNPEKE